VHIQDIKFKGIEKLDRWFKVMLIVGVATLILSFYLSPTRTWINLLVDNFYFVSLSLFGGFFLALISVTNSSFGSPYKRILEAMTAFLPYGLVLMALLIFFGGHHLYIWTHSDIVMKDEILKGKSSYLNLPFFSVRTALYFGLWIIFTKLFVSKSRAQDHSRNPLEITQSLVKYSAIFLVVFALTYCLASFDWIMSLEPHWYSTVFGVYCFSSMFVIGLAFVSVTVISLQGHGYLKNSFSENQYHDLSKLLFGFTTFFAYIWFCQYLLIWYANISEEAEYYVLREHYGWDWLFWLSIIINWLIPFIVLLPRKLKRGTAVLWRVALLVLIGQWLNIYILVAPKVYEHLGVFNPQIGWPEIGLALGYVGFFGLVFFNELKKVSLLPLQDPYLLEGLSLEQ
jgi:hypothetical protein